MGDRQWREQGARAAVRKSGSAREAPLRPLSTALPGLPRPPFSQCLRVQPSHTMSAAMLTRSAMRTQVFAARTSARASTRGRRNVCVRATVSAMGGRRAAELSAGDRGLALGPPAASLPPSSGVNGGLDGNAGPSSGASPPRPAGAMG
jgi:hypothetical protein